MQRGNPEKQRIFAAKVAYFEAKKCAFLPEK